MTADSALRLQAARDHLTLAGEELATINAGADTSAATQTAQLKASVALAALRLALALIPEDLLMPSTVLPAAALEGTA